MRLRKAAAALVVGSFVCALACSSGSGGGGGVGAGGTGSGSGTSSVIGAWYGTGPDGDQCFVMCANGKMFSADSPCSETTASDYDSYLSYTVSGATVDIAAGSSACWLSSSPCAGSVMSWTVSGDSASIAWCGYTFSLNRTAESSTLCEDPARQPC